MLGNDYAGLVTNEACAHIGNYIDEHRREKKGRNFVSFSKQTADLDELKWLLRESGAFDEAGVESRGRNKRFERASGSRGGDDDDETRHVDDMLYETTMEEEDRRKIFMRKSKRMKLSELKTELEAMFNVMDNDDNTIEHARKFVTQ